MLMPEKYIIDRLKHENNGDTKEWWSTLKSLSEYEYNDAIDKIKIKDFSEIDRHIYSKKFIRLSEHYSSKRL